VLRIEACARVGSLELDVALEVAARGCLALAGPSGAGKTTALRIAAGLRRPEAGRVTCGDEVWLDTERGVDLPPEQRRCGYVFQDYALFPHLNALQNVAYALRELPRAERRGRARELLEGFGVGHLANARPRTLSGGERQRVALARALARRPRALLLDEPLAALDTRTHAHAARELAATIARLEAPALLVTHDFSEAALLADRVAVIDRGRIVQEGSAADLAARPRSAFVADFTGAAVLTGIAQSGPSGLTRVELDGGGEVLSTDRGAGPVSLSVHPTEIAIEPSSATRTGSAQNRLAVEVVSVTPIGNRARIGLTAPQPLAAEITDASARALDLAPGVRVTATWKAAATRLVGR